MFYRSSNKKGLFDYFIELANEVQSAAKLLKDLLSDHPSDRTLFKKIKEHEHIADTIVHEIIKQMSTSYFILPLDREDIIRFATNIDDVIDYIHGCAEAYSEIFCLTETTPYAKHFVELIDEVCDIILQFCQLVKQTSKNAPKILEQCIKVHSIENQADELKKIALRELFQMLKNDTINVPTYIAWGKIYNILEIVTDKAEDCANIAEEIVLKYS